MEIIEKAPAKINLSLDTPFRHLDGAPEWRMVMTAVDLADYVQVKSAARFTGGVKVETDKGFLPQDYHNLAYQAAKKCSSCLRGGIKVSKSEFASEFQLLQGWAAVLQMLPQFCEL